jgi:hypothetical protein
MARPYHKKREKKIHNSNAVVFFKGKKKKTGAGRQLLMPVILATQEAEIRRITVQSLPRQIVQETLS